MEASASRRSVPAEPQPDRPDADALTAVTRRLTGAPPPVTATPRAGVDLCLLDLRTVDGTRLDTCVLDEEEHTRRRSLLRSGDRRRFTVAHIALRRLLARRIGTDARSLAFTREPCPLCAGPHGRPAVLRPSAEVHFSLSHGGDFVLVGLADRPIGVDVQPFPSGLRLKGMLRALHPAEQTEFAALPPDADPAAAFARLWSRKEAYLKALGTGLARGLSTDYLGTTGLAPTPQGWHIADLAPVSSHAAAYALPGPAPAALRIRSLPAALVY
ncbi:4'-phosphopantetheinyl transferase family protein [Streptomyces sp. NPDC092296]|uniref:4'-phosphopantetheinyl transferase family protein n=1 Tax=Streptomyces sp. NPDC092296 TaxID=3366012 RepID=UPI00382FAC03